MVSRFAVLALGLGASVTALTAHAQNAATTAPITDIRLSSGGLAEVRRQAEVRDNAALTLTVPLDQVDDVLKSLTVRDPNGAGSSATLAGKEPLDQAFKGMPFSAGDLASQPGLLDALRGAIVTVSGDGRETKGRIAGVERYTERIGNDETVERYRITIVNDGKITAFPLEKVDVTVEDPALRAKIRNGLDAVQAARAGEARDIAVMAPGSGQRTISIDYVVPAPIWKATYRLSLPRDGGKADIQGWAIIENTSSDNWKNVRLSLSSGSPVTLHQRLHEAYYAKRPEVPVYGPNGIVPLADKGGEILERADAETAVSERRVSAEAPASPASRKDSSTSRLNAASAITPAIEEGNERRQPLATASEEDTTTLFTLANPVSLARGQSLTLPFLTAKMSANRVSVFQPQLGIVNPVAAVMVKNEGAASLPPGILTLTEDGTGYAGDAQLAGLPANETRMILFAVDRKITITTDAQSDQKLSQITYDNGMLKAETVTRTNVTYKIRGATDADRIVIIEHPRRAGFSYASGQKESETPTAIRLKVSVAKGAAAETKLTEQRTLSSTYALSDIENRGQTLAIWAQQAGTDPKLLGRIKDAADALAKVNAARQALAGFDGEIQSIKSDQERIRENLKAVPATSDLAKTYLAAMADQEKRLAEIASLRRKGEKALESARAELSDKLKAF